MSSKGQSSLKELHDDDVARLFKQTRDGRYFEELFQRHGRSVFISCLNFHRNSDAAEDAVQETFLRAYQNLDTYAGGGLRSWLLRIARNNCIDRWRRIRPEVSYQDSSVETFAVAHQTVGTAVHLALLQLERELADLPARQQECLELKAEGLSYEEAAYRIGGTPEEVRSHLQNGRRTLRLRMAGVLSEIL